MPLKHQTNYHSWWNNFLPTEKRKWHGKLQIGFLKKKASKQISASTCSAGLLNAGDTDMPATRPEPDRISFRMPLIPRSSKVFAPWSEPLAQVERSRIKPCISRHIKIHSPLRKQMTVLSVIQQLHYRVRRSAKGCLTTSWVAGWNERSSLSNKSMITEFIKLLRGWGKSLCNPSQANRSML